MYLILALLTALSFPATAEVYKWTDAEGVTHFGTQPPPGQQEKVDIRDTSASADAPAAESDIIRQVQDIELRKRQRAAERSIERSNDQPANRQAGNDGRPNYVCQGIENRLIILEEDMEDLKRQGYTIGEKNRLERRIKREEMHRDNLCR